MTSIGEKIVFLHVPKTGGTWAVQAMKAAGVDLREVGMHANLRDLSAYEGRFRIAFVREPFSWYRSWWVFRHTLGGWEDGPLDRIGRGEFEEFMRRAMEELPGFVSKLYEQFIGKADGAVEFVGRYERLVDDLVTALKMAGQDFDEEKLRTFPPKNVAYYAIDTNCPAELRERLKHTERRAYDRFYPEYLLPRRGRRFQVQRSSGSHFPRDMSLTPLSQRPTRLPEPTVRTVLGRPVPALRQPDRQEGCSTASIIVVTHGNLPLTRMCLESVLANTEHPGYEIVVVDNASGERTHAYLLELAKLNPHVRLALNSTNAGFARACEQGLAIAEGDVLVLLGNDTLVLPGWLSKLAGALEDESVGLAGPVTNLVGNGAGIEADYETWGELVGFAARRARDHEGRSFDIRTLPMVFLAGRRDAFERIGLLDQRFEIGLLEDDVFDSVREAGYRVVCLEDVFVHHFGGSSLTWSLLTNRIKKIVSEKLPPDATVLVVSRGDERLLDLGNRPVRHFPEAEAGVWLGHHPVDSAEAVAHLEAMRERGGQFLLFPRTGLWWLEHYEGLREHLESRYKAVVRDEDTCVIFALNRRRGSPIAPHGDRARLMSPSMSDGAN